MPHSRFSRQIFRILVMLALAAGVAGAPSRLAAQASQPAGNSASAAQPADQPAAQPEKKSQEEQETVFRLEGPVVKWTAKTFSLSPGTTANIFEGINFAIIVFGIGIPLFRFLPNFLRGRTETVRADIQSARKATEEANARLSAIEAKLSGLDGEIAGIRAQVEAESLGDEARIKATIGEESARILAAAEQEIDSSAAQARRSLRHFAADLAISQAVQQLAITPETDQALIAEFLTNVTPKVEPGNGAHKGGKK
jgi:F-type H+-transporting ATPase subunit b